MRKGPGSAPPAPGSSASAAKPDIPIPWTVDVACIAIVFEVIFTMLRAVALRGYTSQLSQWLIDQNNKATGKNKKSPYGAAQVAHDLSQLRSGVLLQSAVVAVALLILGYSLRRPRGASGARWALLIVIILTSGPLAVVPVSGWPMLPKVAGVLMGVASIVVILAMIVPQSMNYFRDCKAATRPAGAQARPGLAGLFGPRGAMAQRGMASGQSAAERAQRNAAGRGGEAAGSARPRSKAKVRAEADAVAKGAELARARAKASKSRRSES